jgi:nucleotide-binding universal stress UspA family protein
VETDIERRVVVGVDGSHAARLALRWAAREAFELGLPLEVVHAWTVPPPVHADAIAVDEAPFLQDAHAVLASAIGWLRSSEEDLPDLQPVLVARSTVDALLEAGEHAALLVVGSRGRGGFAGLLLGSVSQRCVQRAPCPIAVVPPEWPGTGDGRVVVGIDGSEESHHALVWAMREATRRGARLEVVNAFMYHLYVTTHAPSVILQDDVDEASGQLLKRMIESATSEIGARPPAVDLASVPDAPVHALLESAKDADLLVVGTHGRGAVAGFLLGSVSQQCVTHARCPVVVVPGAQTPG